MSSSIRLFLSALISFVFYFGWAYWANSLVTDDQSLVLRSALVQGSYSGTVSLLFTMALEWSVKRFGPHSISLALVVPIICAVHSKTSQNIAIFRTFSHALNYSAKALDGRFIPGTLLAPLLPLIIQASLVIGVNVINQTPNLWLTVAPSIILTAIYAYTYTFTLLHDKN